MMRVFNQDPAGDAGRRAAEAGLPISACPYPHGNWLGDRWRAAWGDEMASLSALERREFEPPEVSPGRVPYSLEETQSIQAMLARGHDAAYIARALKRPLHSVQVKIGAMLKSERSWSPEQDTDLIARARRGDRPSLAKMAAELGRTVNSVGARLAHLGVRLRDLRIQARAAE